MAVWHLVFRTNDPLGEENNTTQERYIEADELVVRGPYLQALADNTLLLAYHTDQVIAYELVVQPSQSPQPPQRSFQSDSLQPNPPSEDPPDLDWDFRPPFGRIEYLENPDIVVRQARNSHLPRRYWFRRIEDAPLNPDGGYL